MFKRKTLQVSIKVERKRKVTYYRNYYNLLQNMQNCKITKKKLLKTEKKIIQIMKLHKG